MSGQHTQGRLVVRNLWLVPESHADRDIGGSSNPQVDAEHYAHHIGSAEGKRDYHNNEANARRLAACWNLCDGITTNDVEMMVKGGGLTAVLAVNARVAIADDREIISLQAQIAAARALLADVFKDVDPETDAQDDLFDRISAFLKGPSA